MESREGRECRVSSVCFACACLPPLPSRGKISAKRSHGLQIRHSKKKIWFFESTRRRQSQYHQHGCNKSTTTCHLVPEFLKEQRSLLCCLLPSLLPRVWHVCQVVFCRGPTTHHPPHHAYAYYPRCCRDLGMDRTDLPPPPPSSASTPASHLDVPRGFC